MHNGAQKQRENQKVYLKQMVGRKKQLYCCILLSFFQFFKILYSILYKNKMRNKEFLNKLSNFSFDDESSFFCRSFVRSSVAIGHLHNHEVAENENAFDIAFDIAFAMKTHVRSHIQRVMDRSLNNETITTMKKLV